MSRRYRDDEVDLTLDGVAEFEAWNHPLAQASFWSVPKMYKWQRMMMTAIAKPGAWVVGSTANKTGKTSIIVTLMGLSIMSAFPGATVISTAGQEEQIEGQLFKYLQAKIKPYEKSGWRVDISNLRVTAPSVDGMPESTWQARVPRDPKTFEGYHGRWEQARGYWRWCPVAVIIDEAKSVREEIKEEAERIDPDWCLAISTPYMKEGFFYEAIDPNTLTEYPGRAW